MRRRDMVKNFVVGFFGALAVTQRARAETLTHEPESVLPTEPESGAPIADDGVRWEVARTHPQLYDNGRRAGERQGPPGYGWEPFGVTPHGGVLWRRETSLRGYDKQDPA